MKRNLLVICALSRGMGLGFSVIANHLFLDFSMCFGDTNSYVTKNESWSAGIGGNYRYWFSKSLFIEGTAGIQYRHGTIETKDGTAMMVMISLTYRQERFLLMRTMIHGVSI